MGGDAATRSKTSQEFEQFWHALPRDGAIPHRRCVVPRAAARFLPNLVLMQTNLAGAGAFPLRLVGSAIEARIERKLTGCDYLDFLPGEYRQGAVESARLIAQTPCGLWQITPLHYARGFSQNCELTMFPLRGDDATPLIVACLEWRDDLVVPAGPHESLLHAGTAREFAFLDLGAGEPHWLAA
ncbi:MAG TPA: PAS domain-containing protein [Rhizomicrobium sp.]